MITSKARSSSTSNRVIRPTLLLTTIGFWITLNCYYLDSYIRFIHTQSGWTKEITALIIVLWIVLTSFYAGFHLMSFLFSLLARRLGKKAVRNYASTPSVAILYTCMNDMKEEAVAACLAQDYPCFAVYVLDDSSTSIERKRVDALKHKCGGEVSVIRREKRTGFKAGNLNNALGNIGNQYEYVCVVDADELIPPTFLREMVAIAESDKQLGFVQAAHHQFGETEYGRQAGGAVDLHWNYFLPARNLFGFVYSYGHGVLLRSEALVAVGGFPEVVSEDIALSTKLREAGYRGYFAYDITSSEETPPSYQAFRRRNKKITTGTLDFLYRFYPSFLRAANVSLVEKIDLLVALSVIYLPILFVCFLFLLYCVMPLLSLGSTGDPYTGNVVEVPESLQSWDFVAFVFFTVFAPICYLIPNALRSPKKTVGYILKMGTIHLSVCLQTVGAALRWFATRRASFRPTGDRSYRVSVSFGDYVEYSLGVGMIVAGFFMGSLCLMAVGLSLAIVPILIRNNLSGRLTPLLIVLPALMTIFAILGTPILAVVATSMFAGVALAYH
jgi:cellulose synthase/poly-beta-1,6-N-acetylglucosamine synthase-like glycosyltransferase